jgi:hypothetical protein
MQTGKFGIRVRKPFLTLLFLLGAVPAGTLWGAKGTAAPARTTQPASAELTQIRGQVKQALADLQAIQKKLETASAASNGAELQRQIDEENARLVGLQNRLQEFAAALASDPPADGADVKKTTPGLGENHPKAFPAGAARPLAASATFDKGFDITSEDRSYSIHMNGLFQIRYTAFKPQDSVVPLGANPAMINNFDVYLGRLAVSGSAFDPSLKYFLQFQGSTAGDSNTASVLDWFISKTFSKHLALQAGRFWTPYTYEYYDSPGNYLLADLSTAEYAFVLPRVIGLEASGQAGRLSYAGVVGNSIPALDAPGQENFSSRVSYIGHAQFDTLSPYGFVESDPSQRGAMKPELTLWASAAYNPVAAASSFENVMPGDKTVNATGTLGFRYRFFTLQTTGYFRRTTPATGLPADDSWGYGEQAGFYLLPGRLEIAERISGVNWGAPDFLGSGFAVNTWYSGPNFPYHNITEHSLGVNYYLHGHHAKIQVAYSYLTGNTFTHARFGGNRVWIQPQLMF